MIPLEHFVSADKTMSNTKQSASPERRVAIVTGANNGIGYETAVGLALADCKVVMACRSRERAEQARQRLLARVPHAEVDILLLDLSKQSSVLEFAEDFRASHDHLDLLVNNAGLLDYTGSKNEKGDELQFATNHLGHFLLTCLLIDLMPDSSISRVVSLSSVAHKQGRIHFDDIQCEHVNNKGAAYAQSKLACLMFSSELQRRLEDSGKQVLSVCAHPGGSDSGLFDDMSRLQYYLLKLVAPLITHSNEAAAKPSLHAALESNVKGGEYFGPQGFMDLKGPVGRATRTPYSEDTDVAAKLWRLSEEMIGRPFVI